MRRRLTTMLKRLLIVFCLLLVGACDSSPTLATTPTPPTNTSPLDPANQVRVTGRVTDERGIPIAGASLSVFVYPGGTFPGVTVSTVTDGGGSYELSGAFGSRWGFALSATRDGYETNSQWVPSGAEPVQKFRLGDVVRITTGEGRRVVVVSEYTLYGTSE